MFHRKIFLLMAGVMGMAVLGSLLVLPVQVQARALPQRPDGSNCITCHEDLYLLHDTGKSFCMNDSPMRCVDCHGGDPAATTKEAAHFDRSAHPIINADDKKCYECHPVEAADRVDEFRQVAGVSPVLVAQPCEPEVSVDPNSMPLTSTQTSSSTAPAIVMLVVSGLVMAVLLGFALHRM